MPDVARSTVLAIFAHPDDESLACGGTLARLSDAGVRVVLMCGSRGESGSVSDPALLADGDLAAVRTRELREAAAILGISEVIVMDHPDGDLRWDKVSEFHDDIVEAIRAYQPEAVITFAEDGLYWHLDHVGVHERTYTAVKSFGDAAPPLYYVTMPSGGMREVVEAAHAKGGAPPDSSFWGINPDAFGDSATPPTFSMTCATGRRANSRRCAAIVRRWARTIRSRGSTRTKRASGSASSTSAARRSMPRRPGPSSSNSVNRRHIRKRTCA